MLYNEIEVGSYFPSVASCQHGIDMMQLSKERANGGQDLWQEKLATPAQTASVGGIPGIPGAGAPATSAIVVSPASSS